MKMKIISWNINGIRAILKKTNIINNKNKANNTFIEYLKKEDADIYCFSEIKLCLKNVDLEKMLPLKNYYKYYNTCSNTIKKGSYSGVLVLSKIKPKFVNIDFYNNIEGRFIHLEYEKFNLINLYVPNSGEKLKRLEYRTSIWDINLIETVKKLNEQNKNLILCGDFNSVHLEIDSYDFKKHNNKLAGVTNKEIFNFKKLLNQNLINVFREFYPNKIQFSYYTYRFKAREHNKGLLIDFFLVSKKLKDNVKKIEYQENIYGSDHLPVLLIIDF